MKSDDPESPSYVPSLFAFTTSPERKRIYNSLSRFEAVQRRRQSKEVEADYFFNNEPEPAPIPDDGDAAALPDTAEPVVFSDNCDSSPNTHSVTVEIQTDLTMSQLTSLEYDCQQRVNEMHIIQQEQSKKSYPTEENLKADQKLLTFYTGLTSAIIFNSLFQLVSSSVPHAPNSKLSNIECFILTLMKLRLNLSNYDLGFRFSVCETTVGRILKKWIVAMDIRLSPLIAWPDRNSVQKTMPYSFRRNYGLSVISIIDCFEIFIEKPSNLLAKSCTWSSYKHYNTAKYLISITPQGVINFISRGWGGRTSDKYITEHSGYLRKLCYGDVVLADRGFNISDSIAVTGATLAIPPYTRGRNQISAIEVENTRKLANARIHVERVIGVMRQRFSILSATGVLPKDLVKTKLGEGVLLDSIVRVCCALNNVCEGIVPFD